MTGLIGFFAFYAFHSTQLLISIDLAVVGVGMSFAPVGVMNIIMLATPPELMGISTGTTILVRIIGSAIGPAIAGMFMQSQQQILKINRAAPTFQSFPTGEAYNLLFLTAAMLSISSIGFAIMAARRHNTVPKIIHISDSH